MQRLSLTADGLQSFLGTRVDLIFLTLLSALSSCEYIYNKIWKIKSRFPETESGRRMYLKCGRTFGEFRCCQNLGVLEIFKFN